jgi:flagellar basal-body rod protein FlgG
VQRGLYIAATGMLAEQIRQDQLANDLANASTVGYKPERSMQRSFSSLLLENTLTGQTVGPLSLGAGIAATRTDFSQGALRQTGDTLDVALTGEGFLAIQTPAGIRYTRNGQFTVDGGGRLVTSTGAPVLGTDGRPIAVAGESGLQIAPDGTVRSGGQVRGTIAVVSLTNPVRQGDNAYTGTPGARPAGTQLAQGYLEGSGVDATRAMVDMIVSLRTYEASQRVVRTIDETLGRAVNSVGSATGQ